MASYNKGVLRKKLLFPLFISLFFTANVLAVILVKFNIPLLHQAPKPHSSLGIMQSICNAKQNVQTCYQMQFIAYAKKHEITDTTNVLSEMQRSGSIADCHLIAHLVGQVEVQKQSNNVEKLLEQIDPTLCASGLMHGILEENARISKKTPIDMSLIKKTCNKPRANDPHGISCIHAAGHLVYLSVNGSLKDGIALCRKFIPEIDLKSYQCYRGLFMEHTTKENTLLHGIKIKDTIGKKDVTDMEKICNSLDGYAAKSCWEEISKYYLVSNNSDMRKAFLNCSRAKQDENRKDCEVYLGMQLITATKSIHTTITDYCRQYKSHEEQNSCQLTLVSLRLFHIPKSTPEVIDFCKSLTGNMQQSCFVKVGRTLTGVLPRKEIDNYCLAAPKTYRNDCTNGST